MCGKPNPEDLEECQHCGARLKPLLASSPPEESRPPTPPSPPDPVEPAEPAAPSEPVQEGGDWLDDLRGEVDAGTDELSLTGALDPTRLEPPPERKSPEPGEEGTPEWLQRLRKKRTTQPDTPETGVEEPDEVEPPVPPTGAEGETPTWLEHFREPEEEAEPTPEQPAPETPPRASGPLRERLDAVERDDRRS